MQSRQAADFITTPKKNKPADSQMNYILSKFGHADAAKTTVEDFATNPGNYGFSQVAFKDAQPGDVYVLNENGVPIEALLSTGRDNDGQPLFDYVDWTKNDKLITNQRYEYPHHITEDIVTVFRPTKK